MLRSLISGATTGKSLFNSLIINNFYLYLLNSTLNFYPIKSLNFTISADVDAVNRIPIVNQLLDVVCRTTGMGFAAIARVTDEQWITCTTKDDISFGLNPGDELELETTICHEVRQKNEAVFIDHVKNDSVYCNHHTPRIYGIESYISVPIYRKDGSIFGTLCAIDPKPKKINTPEIRGMFRLFADLISFHLYAIEEKNAAVEKLKEEKKNAELREQFIAMLGHDLKNPLATTRMSADILLKTTQDEMTKRHAAMIKSTSFRMQGLIENILDFARGKLGEGISLNRKSNNGTLIESIEQVIKEMRTNTPERIIETEIALREPVYSDRDRIGQVLSNLLGNAETHGAVDAPIKVKATTADNTFSLSVINQGEKIPDSAMENLFKPFYRKDTTAGKKGLGLGLYIASEIARAHDGSISVKSTEEETRFTFEMPLGKTEESAAAE